MSGSDTDIEVIKDEVLWLLIACYVIKSMDTDPGVKFETRCGIGNWLFSRTTVFESIIMRACRLDDDSPSNWSFRTAQKRLNSEIKDQKRISNIIRLTKQYRQEINQIKVYIRNNGLAHIPINEKPEITEFNPVPFLKIACEILDDLIGEKVNFTYSCGAYEKIDLREHYGI